MENVIQSWVEERGKLHFTLIDPEKQKPEEALESAVFAEKYGSDAIMVGGSTVDGVAVDETCRILKEGVSIPIILFPSSAKGVSKHADYLFFMSLLNSRDPQFIIGEQVKAAPHIPQIGLKTIPMGYIVISTSSSPTAVEVVGKVDRISESDSQKAVSYALTAQYLGMHCVYLEAGSGAEKPVSDAMINSVKKSISVPLIVGGGICNPQTAKQKVDAGADVIVTGNIAEEDRSVLSSIIKTVK
ncbi:MAG: geranylgeranylglyceryl/heptaprenylglyceryl phosphate synthase [Methanobacteriota archaeon]